MTLVVNYQAGRILVISLIQHIENEIIKSKKNYFIQNNEI